MRWLIETLCELYFLYEQALAHHSGRYFRGTIGWQELSYEIDRARTEAEPQLWQTEVKLRERVLKSLELQQLNRHLYFFWRNLVYKNRQGQNLSSSESNIVTTLRAAGVLPWQLPEPIYCCWRCLYLRRARRASQGLTVGGLPLRPNYVGVILRETLNYSLPCIDYCLKL